MAQQRVDPAIAVAAIILRQRDDVGRQATLVGADDAGSNDAGQAPGRSAAPILATPGGPARSPHDDGRGSKTELACFLKNRLVQREIGHQLLQPDVLPLRILHPPSLIDLQATIFVAPPVQCLLRNADLAASLHRCRAPAHEYIHLTQLRDNLFRRKSLKSNAFSNPHAPHGCLQNWNSFPKADQSSEEESVRS